MSEFTDRWSRWLLQDRFGGDTAALERTLGFLKPIRDRVIAEAGITADEIVIDVGCGDGLLGFAAVPLVGENGRVILADISDDLLERCRRIATEIGVTGRCQFLNAAAESLDGIDDASVDVVMTRSVLIYVQDKAAALAAFYRVLKPGGRISLFEPINSRYTELNQDTLFGYDVTPIVEVAAKVWAVYEAAAPPEGPMMSFDETDLLRLAEGVGFTEIKVTLELSSKDKPPYAGVSWRELMKISPNPNAPSFGEAIQRALTPQEASRLKAYLHPLVDQGSCGRLRTADAYVAAMRPVTSATRAPV